MPAALTCYRMCLFFLLLPAFLFLLGNIEIYDIGSRWKNERRACRSVGCSGNGGSGSGQQCISEGPWVMPGSSVEDSLADKSEIE